MRISNLLVSGSTVTSLCFYSNKFNNLVYVFHDPFYGFCAYAYKSSMWKDDEAEAGFFIHINDYKLAGTRFGCLLERRIKGHIRVNEKYYNNKKVVFRVCHQPDFTETLNIDIKFL